MRYLKGYNESKNYNIIEDVKDILLEWSDKDAHASVSEGGNIDINGWHSAIYVNIGITREGIDVDTAVRLFNYMISEGYNCSKIHLTDNNGADDYIYIDTTKSDFGIDEGDINSWRYLDILFLKIKKLHEVKTYKIFESDSLVSIKHDIDDILIDITDDNSNYNISANVDESKVDICVSFGSISDQDVLSPTSIGRFTDNLERLIDYLESIGYQYDSAHYYNDNDGDPICPECKSSTSSFLLDPNYYCRKCKMEFESPVELTKSDMIDVIRNNTSMDFLYLSFKKSIQ